MSDSATFRNYKSERDARAIGDVRSLVSIALQSQYSHSQKYRALSELFREELDASPQLDSFFTYIMNPETATGAFLDWWAARVGVSRSVIVDGEETLLEDDLLRALIFYRAMCNVSDGSAYSMIRLLERLSGFPVELNDMQDMTLTVLLYGVPDGLLRQLIRLYGLLNRPAGVLANIYILDPAAKVFGFKGQNLQPFNQGAFIYDGFMEF